MEPGAYQTYRISAPTKTHWVSATCAEIECEPYMNGWTSSLDISTPQGMQTAQAIKDKYKQGSYTVQVLDSGLVQFKFIAGLPCFKSSMHKRQIGPDILLVQGGDYRGNPRGIATRVHTKPEFWAEDFAENQLKLARLIERG
jgi:hypothetical protein